MSIGLGVTVVEVDGRTAPSITTASTSVAGFLVRSPRGPAGTPVHVRGFADFATAFGGFTDFTFGAHAVRGFFDNGGADAWVVRVVGASATAASARLTDRAGAATLQVQAGARGRPEPGAWGNRLSVRVEDHPLGVCTPPPQVVGTESEPFNLSGGGSLTLSAGSATLSVPLEPFKGRVAVSAEEVAQAVNSATTVVRAAVAPGGQVVLALADPSVRAWTRLAVTSGGDAIGLADGRAADAAAPAEVSVLAVTGAAGFTPGSVVRISARGHVRGTAAVGAVADGSAIVVTADGGAPETISLAAADLPAAPTAAAVAAVVNRKARRVRAHPVGDLLVLTSLSEGPTSKVVVAPPPAGTPDARAALGLDTAVPVDGSEDFRTLTATSEKQRLLAWDPGDHLAVTPSVTAVRSTEFDLMVLSDTGEVERFESLTITPGRPRSVETLVNDPSRGSNQVVVRDLRSNSGAGLNVPRASDTVRLGTGPGSVEGTPGGDPTDADFLGDPALRTGLVALEQVGIQLLACPETTSAAVAAGCLAHCERRGDAMFVGTVPEGLDPQGAAGYAAALRGRKVYGALYAPWIDVLNPLDRDGSHPTLRIPPVGQVMGVYARIADTRAPWKAPAGDEARILDAVGVAYLMTDAVHTTLVRDGGVNGIRAMPGAGIVVDASRTLSTDTRWLYVNVRRLFNLVKSSLRDGLTWVVQEPNTEELRRSVAFNVVTPFLLGLWSRGAFGSDPPQSVFTVRCDATNNPPADVQQGIFTVEVLFYPTKPAESILVVVGQQDDGAQAQDT